MSEDFSAKDFEDRPWKVLADTVRNALSSAWENGVPPHAAALYARWWQLESWLRSLIYVELRSKAGSAWPEALGRIPEARQLGEAAFRYMATPDAQNRLAYADASVLFRITLDHWNLFEPALLAKSVWTGRIDELLAIRNRIGHCRRPHPDDLMRLEQTLRDLEVGAFAALCSFNERSRAKESWADPVTEGWVRRHHADAVRLIDHARVQYETIFCLEYSRRPWAAPNPDDRTVSGVAGFLWHATWYFRGGRQVQLDKFWRSIDSFRDAILFACANDPSSLSVSFSAVEDPYAISDAIGYFFDAALMTLFHERVASDYHTWAVRYADIDSRLQVGTPWACVEPSMQELSIFGA